MAPIKKMERTRKLELIQRSLALRHKIKVHESLDLPKSHEELSVYLLSKWELEDELSAIEELLAEDRRSNANEKKELIEKGIIKKKKTTARSTTTKKSK